MWLREKGLQEYGLLMIHDNEYTPFAFDTVQNSMRIMVDGDDIRVAFSKDLCTKGTP